MRALTATVLSVLAVPNVALGLYLVVIGGRGMAHADGMGEGMVALGAFVMGGLLALIALPSVWWAVTVAKRNDRANRVRLIIGALLTLGSFVPVALFVNSFRR